MSYQSILQRINQKEIWNMIVIDGVVGVGKTKLMEILKRERGYVPFEEPVINNPLLEKFYHDRRRYSFSLQVLFLNQRFKDIKIASQIEKSVMDRSIYGDVIFAKLLHEGGDMSTEEYQLYIDLFGNMLEHVHPPKLMIYLEASVDEAVRRIQKRGRDYEQIVEREYWEKLNQSYREYFSEYTISPLLKINVDNLDFENNPEDQKYVLDQIDQALFQLV